MSFEHLHFHQTISYFLSYCQVYVDGKERGNKEGSGLLAGDWGYKASIGYYDFDDRRINGWLDEFLIYDFSMGEEEVFKLLGKMRCPISNITSVEIDAFEFENINLKKRAVVEKHEEAVIYRIHNKQNINNMKNNSMKMKTKRSIYTSNYLHPQYSKTMKENIKDSLISNPFVFNIKNSVVSNRNKENPHR